MDLSLKDLRIYYKCQDKGEINQSFDKEIRELAKKYGLTFWASGINHTNGVRDVCFDTSNQLYRVTETEIIQDGVDFIPEAPKNEPAMDTKLGGE